ncbi:hypothetical protein APU01nite_04870 [Alkalibacterium putridalgicola]|uniref:Uncharacterized protein n=1 Tax=Alkalibacterium putridalgicola TaxID=426703 RepID=A0ABQ0UV86_9LACT|nr:hypothetical protein APU01nite_04870 [Alkalibacterium putridalgicola]
MCAFPLSTVFFSSIKSIAIEESECQYKYSKKAVKEGVVTQQYTIAGDKHPSFTARFSFY